MADVAFELVAGELPHYSWADAPPGVRAVFTMRAGGFSRGPYAHLNLGTNTEDDVASVAHNRLRLADEFDLHPDDVARAAQVHGTRIVDVAELGRSGEVEADGITLTGRAAAMVTVADCAPVVVAGPAAVVVVHGGWRGVVGGVVEQAVALAGERGTVAVAVGPAIGPCCFAVGADVAAAFNEQNVSGNGQSRHADLPGEVELRARAAGARVDTLRACTSCDERFFSHRRSGGVSGRQCGLAWRN